MPLRPSPHPGRALPLGWDRDLEMDGSPLRGTPSAPQPPSLHLQQAASFPITGRPQGHVRHRDFPQEPGPNMPSDSVWATFSVLCPVLHKRDLMQSSRLFKWASPLCFTRRREGKRLALKNTASKWLTLGLTERTREGIREAYLSYTCTVLESNKTHGCSSVGVTRQQMRQDPPWRPGAWAHVWIPGSRESAHVPTSQNCSKDSEQGCRAKRSLRCLSLNDYITNSHLQSSPCWER